VNNPVNEESFVHGKRVVDLQEFLLIFSISSKPSLLVARFDTNILLQTTKILVDNFKTIIAGFSDSFFILRKNGSTRERKGTFKLSPLAMDLLQKIIYRTLEEFAC
jgi:hypothetical protein